MSTPRMPSATNVFIPRATGEVIAFVRKPSEFKLNEYCQFVKSEKPVGLYTVLDRAQSVRVPTDQEFAWPDGAPAPLGNNNLGNFRYEEFQCDRRAYGYSIGEQVVEAADWKVEAVQASIAASQAYTNKTNRVMDLLENTSNWGTNYADATTLNNGRGQWDEASDDPADAAHYLAIKRSLLEAFKRITLATNATVKIDDMVLLLSPGLAFAISETPEIHNYVKNTPFALAQIRGDKPGQNTEFGLPDRLYGFKTVVENCVYVSTRPLASGADGTRLFAKADDSAVLISRKGGLDGAYGAKSFSTVQCYFYKHELTVESRYDSWNKMHQGRVVDQFKEVLSAPPAGFLITNVM